MLPTHLRFKQRGPDVIACQCTLPPAHPLSPVMDRAKRRVNRQGAQYCFAFAEILKAMEIREFELLELMDPVPVAPSYRGSIPVYTRLQSSKTIGEAVSKFSERWIQTAHVFLIPYTFYNLQPKQQY